MNKRILLAFVSMLLFAGASAQTNWNMETWGSVNGEPEQPTGWVSYNVFKIVLIDPNNPTSVLKIAAPNQYNGNFSCEIKTVVLVTNPDPANLDDTAGVLISGTIDIINGILYDRFPCTARPLNLVFKSKQNTLSGDSAYAFVQLSKWNGVSRDIVAESWYPIQGSGTYSTFTAPLNYLLPIQPDSASIVFSSSAILQSNRKPGSTLTIDDLGFSGYVGINENDKSSAVNLYPNPSTSSLTVDAGKLGGNLVKLEVFDASGKLVKNADMKNLTSVTLNVADLPAGNYTYSIINDLGIRMMSGPFNVVR